MSECGRLKKLFFNKKSSTSYFYCLSLLAKFISKQYSSSFLARFLNTLVLLALSILLFLAICLRSLSNTSLGLVANVYVVFLNILSISAKTFSFSRVVFASGILRLKYSSVSPRMTILSLSRTESITKLMTSRLRCLK